MRNYAAWVDGIWSQAHLDHILQKKEDGDYEAKEIIFVLFIGFGEVALIELWIL